MDYNMEKCFPPGDGPVAPFAPPAYPTLMPQPGGGAGDVVYPSQPAVNPQYGNAYGAQYTGPGGGASVAPIAPLVALGRYPVQVQCPNCRSQVVTQVSGENGAFAWLMAALTCLIAPCCFCIPLCTDCSQDIRHTCPACNAYLGIDKKL